MLWNCVVHFVQLQHKRAKRSLRKWSRNSFTHRVFVLVCVFWNVRTHNLCACWRGLCFDVDKCIKSSPRGEQSELRIMVVFKTVPGRDVNALEGQRTALQASKKRLKKMDQNVYYPFELVSWFSKSRI